MYCGFAEDHSSKLANRKNSMSANRKSANSHNFRRSANRKIFEKSTNLRFAYTVIKMGKENKV
jgi:hypothetical protein